MICWSKPNPLRLLRFLITARAQAPFADSSWWPVAIGWWAAIGRPAAIGRSVAPASNCAKLGSRRARVPNDPCDAATRVWKSIFLRSGYFRTKSSKMINIMILKKKELSTDCTEFLIVQKWLKINCKWLLMVRIKWVIVSNETEHFKFYYKLSMTWILVWNYINNSCWIVS